MTNPKPIELPEWAESVEQDDCGTVAAVTLSGVRFRMRWIEPGTFTMGSPEDEPGRFDDETQHHVTLTQGYWLAETQCTQELWQAVMGENPSRFKGKQRPVETVNWEDCRRFIRRANEIAPGLDLRLPTEAEWEHACRAGTTGSRYGELNDIAWHYGNSSDTTHPVAKKSPNAWGLYDTLGNVWEWCADWFGEYPDRAAIDPKGADEGTLRVLRGGSWLGGARGARSACRHALHPGLRDSLIGFRVARGPQPEEPNGERRESRRADAGGESVASSKAIELPEGWVANDDGSFDNRDRVFYEGDAIESHTDGFACVSRRSIDRLVGSVCIPDAVLAAYLQAKGWEVRKL